MRISQQDLESNKLLKHAKRKRDAALSANSLSVPGVSEIVNGWLEENLLTVCMTNSKGDRITLYLHVAPAKFKPEKAGEEIDGYFVQAFGVIKHTQTKEVDLYQQRSNYFRTITEAVEYYVVENW